MCHGPGRPSGVNPAQNRPSEPRMPTHGPINELPSGPHIHCDRPTRSLAPLAPRTPQRSTPGSPQYVTEGLARQASLAAGALKVRQKTFDLELLWKKSHDESPRFNKFLNWVADESGHGASATIVPLKHLARCVEKKVFRADAARGDADRILDAVQ